MNERERRPARRYPRPTSRRPDAPPPSFAPGTAAPRPTASGARPVGEPPRRPQRRPQAAPGAQGPGAPPPSYAPGGGDAPAGGEPTPRPAGRPAARPVRRRRGRAVAAVLAVLVVLLLAWPVGLGIWADSRIEHVSALSGAPGTPGTTYLLAGSDSRADGAVADATEGQRSDTIMLMHAPESGAPALISLPRDLYVEIPGRGPNKLNAAFSFGGAPLLVETVEDLTGLTVDHYVEIGMGGVAQVVDAVGGVELCLDYDVDDPFSGLVWTAGCRDVDGATALAFARMRYADPDGDIGRTNRQRQVVSSVIQEAATPSTLLDPRRHVELAGAATGALRTDEDTGIVDLARMGLTFRSVTGEDGLLGTPPIADFDYRPGGVGSTVLLDAEAAPGFFDRLAEGTLTAADLGQQ